MYLLNKKTKPLTQKIKAFTISEMLVVLVISSIVIGLALMVLNLVQQQIHAMQHNYTKNTEIRLLERTLWQDFNKHNLSYNQNKQKLMCYSEIDTITYTFTANFVIRNADTLAVPTLNIKTYLDGNSINDKRIDAIELQVSKEIEEKKIFISKIKDATFYMNADGI